MEDKKMDRRVESWHLSKEVPVALIVTMVSMIITMAIGWSKLDSRVEYTERALVRLEAANASTDTRLDSKLTLIQTDIAKIKDQFYVQLQQDLERERNGNGLRRRN